MSDRTGALATCGGLPLERRLADRMLAIGLAADEIRDRIALASSIGAVPASAATFDRTARQIRNLMRPLLPLLESMTTTGVERDAELEDVLLRLDADTAGVADRESAEGRENAWREIEVTAAPYALAFYYEIRRLDSLRLITSHADGAQQRDKP